MKRAIQREKRHEKILSSIDRLGFVSRSQLQRMHSLKSNRNALKVMRELDEYVHSFRHGENVYYLSKQGRERIGSNVIRKRTIQVDHFLMRNEVFMMYGCPTSWQNEAIIEIPNVAKVVSDARFTMGGRVYLVEIDNKQQMNVNAEKVAKYRKLFEASGVTGAKLPKIVWFTTTEARKQKLQALCEGLSCTFHCYEKGV